MSVSREAKTQIIAENKLHEKDSGSADVQIALLTAQILDLTEHMKRHPKDFHSRHGLLKKVNRRNRLSTYLRRVDLNRYTELAAKLGLRK